MHKKFKEWFWAEPPSIDIAKDVDYFALWGGGSRGVARGGAHGAQAPPFYLRLYTKCT